MIMKHEQRRMPCVLSARWMTISMFVTMFIVHDVTLSIPNFVLAYASSHNVNVHNRSPNIRHVSSISLPMTKSIESSTKNNEGYTMTTYNSKYHLIWSPNFWKKMLITTTVLVLMQSKNYYSFDKILFSHHVIAPCHGQTSTTTISNELQRILPTAVVLPLLSSSCCAIQILINAVSGFGCAGFNTYLGPIRPVLLPLLLFSTYKLLPQRSVGWTIISLFLAFLPELVDIWNTIRSKHWQQKHSRDNGSMNAVMYPITAKLTLDCPTMGCVACVNKIDSSIRQCKSAANIREETSWLTEGSAKGGRAELTISAETNDEIDGIVSSVVAAVEDAGFQCEVKSLQILK